MNNKNLSLIVLLLFVLITSIFYFFIFNNESKFHPPLWIQGIWKNDSLKIKISDNDIVYSNFEGTFHFKNTYRNANVTEIVSDTYYSLEIYGNNVFYHSRSFSKKSPDSIEYTEIFEPGGCLEKILGIYLLYKK